MIEGYYVTIMRDTHPGDTVVFARGSHDQAPAERSYADLPGPCRDYATGANKCRR